MAGILESIMKKASALQKNIVLPEGEDSRVVKACVETVKEGFAKVTLLGDESEIKATNPRFGFNGYQYRKPQNL